MTEMDKKTVRAAFDQAKEAVEGIDDAELRGVAFGIVFRKLLEGREPMPATLAGFESQASPRSLERTSIAEFLARLNPQSYPERITGIAFHTLHSNDDERLIRADFFEALSRARIPKPQNLSDVIAQCVRKGHLMDAEPKDGQKTWKITQTGERFIEVRLGDGAQAA